LIVVHRVQTHFQLSPLYGLSTPVFDDPKHHIRLYHGDCLELLEKIPDNSVDLVFADPPYFLSNGGITYHAGKMVSVNKGDWDKSKGAVARFADSSSLVPRR
jgi:16S rRNA G966 N2-methylase RsmD